MVKGGANFFFLSFFLILSSQKIEGGLKGGSMGFWGLGGAGAPLDPVLSPPRGPYESKVGQEAEMEILKNSGLKENEKAKYIIKTKEAKGAERTASSEMMQSSPREYPPRRANSSAA